MNRFLLLFVFNGFISLLIPEITNAQSSPNGTIKLFIEDSKGRIDSVTFGIKDLSTIGIDKTFGENNIYGTPNDSLEIRVIQRDSLNHNCSYYDIFSQTPKVKMYYPENIDSKIDFRPYSFEDYLKNINMNFEIKVFVIDYPVIIKAELNDFINSWYRGWTHIFLVDSNCIFKKELSIPKTLKTDSLFILNDNSIQTLIIKFYHEFSVKDFKPIEPKWEISPNPANHSVTISGLEAFNGKIELIDLSGKLLNTLELNNNNSMIMNFGSIPKGTYFIRCLDETKEEISVRKLIIE